MISRRDFLERSGILASGLALERVSLAISPAPASGPPAPASGPLDPNKLPRFVDPLPIPQAVRPVGVRPDPDHPGQKLPLYRIAMQEVNAKVHRGLSPTRLWGFNGVSPGPLLETRSGEGFFVEWVNELPSRHLFSVDHNLHGAERDKPDVRSVIHLHGGRTPAHSDGYPEDWYLPGKSRIYHYPNRQEAALLFYHDHAMGITRLNTYAGLMGLCIIRDDHESTLGLPSGSYEIPLLLSDRYLREDGQLDYPVSPDPKSPWVPEVFGDAMLANGKLFPYMEVEPRMYRLRVMNGSNARFFRVSVGGLELQQIGSDQGLLAAPVPTKRALLAPAERVDLLVDFSAHAGSNLLLQSDSFDILQFRVADTRAAADTSRMPHSMRPVNRIPESQAVTSRRLTLDETMDGVQQSMGMLLNKTPWHMPVTETPVLNTIEIWEFVNLTEDSHPIHLHLVRFQLLDRRPFDTFQYMDRRELRFTGPARPAGPAEAGWKDTVRADPGEVTRIIVPFEGYAGRYVWHCHILEHEDNEMMRPYDVISSVQAVPARSDSHPMTP